MNLILMAVTMMFSTIAQNKTLMIAHAGGGIKGQNYSNSLEALESNYKKGFRYFELDFSWTADNKLVCLHDWNKRFKQVFGFKTKQALSLEQFNILLKQKRAIHPCTLETLSKWLKSHPDVTLITDVKTDNIKAIGRIIQHFPEIKKQLIPQFYQPYEYTVLKDMGFDQLIWILYQYKGSWKSIKAEVLKMDLFAISMRASQAKNKTAQELNKKGVNLFVYTLNKESKVKKWIKNYHVSGVYTDFLAADTW